MASHRVGFIGAGDPDADGFAMAYQHANGYDRLQNCELTACADIVPRNATAFANEYDITEKQRYEEFEVMVTEAPIDVVSIAVPPAVHAPAAIAAIESDQIEAVHCEKPMALTWGECQEMVAAAEREDVQLTFNHQRRFNPEYREAKRLLDDGEIGELERVETAAPDLYDWGTHCLDLCAMFVDQARPEWVMGQVDYREEHLLFGTHVENQSIALWEYENGVSGFASTGGEGGWIDCGAVECLHRLIGTDGVIELNRKWAHEHAPLRIRRAGQEEWESHEFEAVDAVSRTIEHLITCLDEETTPAVGAEKALQATELIFGTYESSRQRGRIDLPLEVEDNPLISMVESGALNPEPADADD